MTFEFKQFDRALEDLRDAVATAANMKAGVVRRYVAMMKALECAFLLYYDEMPSADKEQMRIAFKQLADIASNEIEVPLRVVNDDD